MANPESKKLAVDIVARVDKLEKEMKKAGRAANDNFQKIERGGKKMADRLERDIGGATKRIGGMFKNFAAGFAGGIAAGGVIGIASQLGEVARSVAEIGDQAKRAGVTTDVFQEWAHVATQARIPVDALTDGLKELSLRGDEFAVTGKGSAAEAFARLGYGAEELKRKLADPSALMLEIIGRLGQLDKAAQIRISDELFGGSAGERFVELLDRGEAGIRSTIDEAHRLGLVMDADVIARAAEIDRQFQIVSRTVGTALKGAIVDAASALQSFIDSFRSFENQQTANLDAELATIGKQRLDLENKILKLRGQQKDAGWNVFGADYAEQIQMLEEERVALGETEAQILRVLAARRKAAEPIAPAPGTTWTPTPYTPPPATGGRDKAAAQAEREADAVRRLIAELEHELRLVGASDLEKEIANKLRDAGAAATDKQREKIIALVSALHAEEEATRKATEAAQELRDIGKDVLGGIISDLRQGKDAADILAGALDRVADRLANMALDALFGGGSGGGFFGGAVFSLNLRSAA